MYLKDSLAREWDIKITISAIRRIREIAAIDLGNFNAFANENLIEKLLNDPVALTDILYAIAYNQAEQRKIDRENFTDAFSGDTLTAALLTLLEAIADFFPAAQKAATQKIIHELKKTLEQITQELNSTALNQDSNTPGR